MIELKPLFTTQEQSKTLLDSKKHGEKIGVRIRSLYIIYMRAQMDIWMSYMSIVKKRRIKYGCKERSRKSE